MNSRHSEVCNFQDFFPLFVDAEDIARLQVAVAAFAVFVEHLESSSEAKHLPHRPQNALLRSLLFRVLPELL